MMRCICLRTCTIRVGGKSVLFSKDQIVDLVECPEHHFAPLAKTKVDFETATVELLLQSDNWSLEDALAYLEDEHNKEVTGPPLSRREMAKLIVDTRERKVVLPNEG